MTLPIVILAGGLATRLGHLARDVPKSLIPVCGRPFIDWQIENIKSSGFTDILICIGHLGEQISDHLGDGKKFGVNIEFSADGPIKLGTGGAILAALDKLPDDFMITYGDSYLPTDLNKIQSHYNQVNAKAMMTVYNNKEELERSNCFFNEGIIKNYSKINYIQEMKHIDYGLSVLNKSVFNSVGSRSYFDLGDLLENLSINDDLFGYEILERYYEVGSIQGIKNLENYLIENGRI